MRRGKRDRAPAERPLTYDRLGETGNKRPASGAHQKGGSAKSAWTTDQSESDEEDYEVQKVVGRRKASSGKVEYKIRWKGFGSAEDTWEPAEQLASSSELVQCFDAAQKAAGGSKQDENDDEAEEDKEYEVERVLGRRANPKGKGFEYKIRWRGYSPKNDTWEPLAGLGKFKNLAREFEASEKKPAPAGGGGGAPLAKAPRGFTNWGHADSCAGCRGGGKKHTCSKQRAAGAVSPAATIEAGADGGRTNDEAASEKPGDGDTGFKKIAQKTKAGAAKSAAPPGRAKSAALKPAAQPDGKDGGSEEDSSLSSSSEEEDLPDRPKRARKTVESFTYAAKGETESSEMERQLKQISRMEQLKEEQKQKQEAAGARPTAPHVPAGGSSSKRKASNSGGGDQETDARSTAILEKWWSQNSSRSKIAFKEQQALADKCGLPLKVVELFIFHNQQQAKKDRAKKPKAATAATGGNTSASAAKASGGVNNGGKGENGSKAAHSPRVPGTDLRQKQMEVVEKWWSKKVAAGGFAATVVGQDERARLADKAGEHRAPSGAASINAQSSSTAGKAAETPAASSEAEQAKKLPGLGTAASGRQQAGWQQLSAAQLGELHVQAAAQRVAFDAENAGKIMAAQQKLDQVHAAKRAGTWPSGVLKASYKKKNSSQKAKGMKASKGSAAATKPGDGSKTTAQRQPAPVLDQIRQRHANRKNVLAQEATLARARDARPMSKQAMIDSSSLAALMASLNKQKRACQAAGCTGDWVQTDQPNSMTKRGFFACSGCKQTGTGGLPPGSGEIVVSKVCRSVPAVQKPRMQPKVGRPPKARGVTKLQPAAAQRAAAALHASGAAAVPPPQVVVSPQVVAPPRLVGMAGRDAGGGVNPYGAVRPDPLVPAAVASPDGGGEETRAPDTALEEQLKRWQQQHKPVQQPPPQPVQLSSSAPGAASSMHAGEWQQPAAMSMHAGEWQRPSTPAAGGDFPPPLPVAIMLNNTAVPPSGAPSPPPPEPPPAPPSPPPSPPPEAPPFQIEVPVVPQPASTSGLLYGVFGDAVSAASAASAAASAARTAAIAAMRARLGL